MWLQELPDLVAELTSRWSLTVSAPFEHEGGSCSWVAPARRSNGERVVLKIGAPHMEADQEIDALQLLNGNPTVHLFEADADSNAMLLEECQPGIPLRTQSVTQQNHVLAAALRRIWAARVNSDLFRPLSTMIAYWSEETQRDRDRWFDSSLIIDGLAVFQELSEAGAGDVLLATDLHAGNVLRARREPWLVIDPKPFIGDPAYDATQHLLNMRKQLAASPEDTIQEFAELLGVDPRRVRLWLFARLAAEPRDIWDTESFDLARRLRG